MKRSFLKELGLDKNTIDKIMVEYGKEKKELLSSIEDTTKLIEENEKLQQELNKMNEKLKGIEHLETTQSELQQQVEKYQLEMLKIKIGYEAGLPLEWAERMDGTTEEELRQDAELIAQYMPKQKKILPSYMPPLKKPGDPLARFVNRLFAD